MFRQLRSLGVPVRVIALGKLLGVTAIVAGVLVPTLTIGIVWLGRHLTARELGDTLPRLGVLGLLYAAYYLMLLGIATAVSTASRSARTALITLLGFWLVNGFLGPYLATEIAERMVFAPSSAAFSRAS
jgi:ABC-2 type transport system permease protein